MWLISLECIKQNDFVLAKILSSIFSILFQWSKKKALIEFFRENYLWKTFDNYGTDSEKILNDQNEQRNNLLVFSKYEIQIKNTINMTFGLSSNNINYRWETIEYNDLDPQSLKSKDSKKYKYQNIISPKISLNKTISNQNLFFTIRSSIFASKN